MPRFKAAVVIVLEIDDAADKEQAEEQVRKQIESIHAQKKTIRLEQLKEEKIRLAVYEPNDIFQHVTHASYKHDYVVGGKTHQVKMNSHRYLLFKKSRSCVCCGILGNKMVLEQHTKDRSPYFNFYAEKDGRLILMTKDHIKAKARGGEDKLSNYQTMCAVCNNLKGSCMMSMDGLREIRQIYEQNKDIMSKKCLNRLLDETRNRLEIKAANASAYFASCDIQLWEIESRMEGKPISDYSAGTRKDVIRKDSQLGIYGRVGKAVYISLIDGSLCVIPASCVNPPFG